MFTGGRALARAVVAAALAEAAGLLWPSETPVVRAPEETVTERTVALAWRSWTSYGSQLGSRLPSSGLTSMFPVAGSSASVRTQTAELELGANAAPFLPLLCLCRDGPSGGVTVTPCPMAWAGAGAHLGALA